MHMHKFRSVTGIIRSNVTTYFNVYNDQITFEISTGTVSHIHNIMLIPYERLHRHNISNKISFFQSPRCSWVLDDLYHQDLIYDYN